MRLARFVIILAMLAPFAAVPAHAEDPAFTPAQQDAIKKLVHDYLVDHPEAIVEAIEAAKEKERMAAEEASHSAILERKADLYNDPNSAVFGNPDGDVTIVEFFDYHCPYCIGMLDSVMNILHEDGKVRLVLKEFPILGESSVFASHAAIASRKQNLYPEFHKALMKLKGHLDEETVMRAAASVGLDTKKLKADMDGKDIQDVIAANYSLARAINVEATPGWVIGDKLTAGAMSPEAFKLLIDEARKSKS